MASEGNLIPTGFYENMVATFVVSQAFLEDSIVPDLHEFLTDPAGYRLKHPWTPPSRRARVNTWIGAKREKLGEKLYAFVSGLSFPDDSW